MNQRLHLLVVLTSPSCTICGHHSEDITHLFFKCYIASNFWKNLHLTRRWHINFDGSSLDSSTWMETWKWVKGQKNALLCWVGTPCFLTAFGRFGTTGTLIFFSIKWTPSILRTPSIWQRNLSSSIQKVLAPVMLMTLSRSNGHHLEREWRSSTLTGCPTHTRAWRLWRDH